MAGCAQKFGPWRVRRGPSSTYAGGRGHGVVSFFKSPRSNARWKISGTTVDSGGSPLGNCVVKIFQTDAYDLKIAEGTSDISGAFTIYIGNGGGTFWAVAELDGAPDKQGITVRDLIAVAE